MYRIDDWYRYSSWCIPFCGSLPASPPQVPQVNSISNSSKQLARLGLKLPPNSAAISLATRGPRAVCEQTRLEFPGSTPYRQKPRRLPRPTSCTGRKYMATQPQPDDKLLVCKLGEGNECSVTGYHADNPPQNYGMICVDRSLYQLYIVYQPYLSTQRYP